MYNYNKIKLCFSFTIIIEINLLELYKQYKVEIHMLLQLLLKNYKLKIQLNKIYHNISIIIKKILMIYKYLILIVIFVHNVIT